MALPIKLKLPKDFLKEEIRCGFVVTEKRKKIWAVELDLLYELMRVCRKYNLKLKIFYGTLLGAVRHRGFIPWDDDLDVCLERKDFEKLQQVAKDEFRFPYFLQTALSDRRYFCPYGRFRNSATTGIINVTSSPDYNNGIYVDVYVYDKCPENRFLFWIYHILYRLCCSLMRIHSYKDHRKGHIKGVVYKALQPFVRLFRFETLYSMFIRLLSSNEGSTKAAFMYEPAWGQKFEEIFDAEDLNNVIELDYEHLKVPAVRDYAKYLVRMYGDYMKYPNPEERGVWHEGEIVFNPEMPYRDYYAINQTDK